MTNYTNTEIEFVRKYITAATEYYGGTKRGAMKTCDQCGISAECIYVAGRGWLCNDRDAHGDLGCYPKYQNTVESL